jgi:hypothetical protein
VRLGRLKIPYGLYNEVFDIDAARVPVLLPGSVYPLQNREILFAHSGVKLYGFARSELLGALEYRLFAGTVFWDPATLVPPDAGFSLTFNIEYVAGARLLWETPLAGLRVAGSVQVLGFESDVLAPMLSILIENDSLLWVASAEYAPGDLTLTAEYSRWQTEQTSTPLIQPDVDQQDERAYAMAAYRLTPWFQPAAYFSLFYPSTEQRSGKQNRQHDAALTLRFDVSPHWILKLEGHYMSGTAGLINSLRVNPPDLSLADETWATFFLKATGHF